MSARGSWLIGALLALGCGGQSAETLPPRGQIMLYLTTDAPLPPQPGARVGADDPPALFDTLRVEVFAPGATEPCSGCSREFELHTERVEAGQASLGIVPIPGLAGYVARARLYRAITRRGDGEPAESSTIDVFAELPAVEREGITEAGMTLHVADVGSSLGSLDAPLQLGELSAAGSGLSENRPDFSEVGTWPPAARVPCSGQARAGEACVPGGAFWLGSPFLDVNLDGSDASETRLVIVSPFYVDLHEVTVANYRASGLASVVDGVADPKLGPDAALPPEAEGALTPEDVDYFCTYSQAESERDERALNCVSWTAADAFCTAQGKQLPSEAEFEYMASGLSSNLFLWGEDAPSCDDAVWGRWGTGAFEFAEQPPCLPFDELGGPVAPGAGARDRLPLEQGVVVDLMGNECEWTRDTWNRRSESCWEGQGLLQDPECQLTSSDGERRTVKGSAWSVQVYPAAMRFGIAPGVQHPQQGFRCVRPGN